MPTYEKDGHLYSHFRPKDYSAWDNHARDVCRRFCKQFGCEVYDNDGKDVGKVDYSALDLRFNFLSGESWYLEAETKLDGFIPRYLHDGVHYTLRKIIGCFGEKKYTANKVLFATTNDKGSELIIVPGPYMFQAYQILPEYGGFGEVMDSSKFAKPLHDCYPIRKFTKRDRRKPEDFITINWGRVAHFVLESNEKWSCSKPPDWQFLKAKHKNHINLFNNAFLGVPI